MSEILPDITNSQNNSPKMPCADTIMAVLGSAGVTGIAVGINEWVHGNGDATTGVYTTAGMGAVGLSLFYAMIRSGRWALPPVQKHSSTKLHGRDEKII